MDRNKIYIHAERVKDEGSRFRAYEYAQTLSDITEDYEYGDVRDKEFQIWEYPSGKMYDVVSDRELEGERYKDYYGLPQSSVWLPKLKYTKTDKLLVQQEYERLNNPPERPSLADRIKSFFRR